MTEYNDNIRQLYDTFGAEIHAFLYRRTNNAERADDLLQETFLAVIKYYKPDVENWRAWLYRIAANASNKDFQSRARHAHRSVDQDGFPEVADERDQAKAKMRQLHEAILSYLASHDPRLEMIYLLRLEFQMEQEEISSTLNIKPRTLSRLVAQMKELVKNHFEVQFFEL